MLPPHAWDSDDQRAAIHEAFDRWSAAYEAMRTCQRSTRQARWLTRARWELFADRIREAKVRQYVAMRAGV